MWLDTEKDLGDYEKELMGACTFDERQAGNVLNSRYKDAHILYCSRM